MRIAYCSIPITDYDAALEFYQDKLGFVIKHDIPLGPGVRWLTLTAPGDVNGVELVLEPNGEYPAMKALKESLMRDGIPLTAFQVDDINTEYERLRGLGVEFTMEPTNMGQATLAMMNDTCGNLIQIFQFSGG